MPQSPHPMVASLHPFQGRRNEKPDGRGHAPVSRTADVSLTIEGRGFVYPEFIGGFAIRQAQKRTIGERQALNEAKILSLYE